jgi:arylsulfatase A-like enzyme
LIVRFPGGVHGGKEVSGLVRGVDIAPMILDTTRVPHPAQFDGFSLATALARGRVRASSVLLWKEMETHGGLRTPDWKMFDGQVYDLRKDPLERTNLTLRNRNAADRLSTQFHAMLRQRPLPNTKAIVPDQETVDKLRSLGYIH